MEFTQINKSVVDLKTKILYQQLCWKSCQLKHECKQELHNKESKHKIQFILQDHYQEFQKKSKNEGQSIMTCKLPYGTHLSKFDDNIVNNFLLMH